MGESSGADLTTLFEIEVFRGGSCMKAIKRFVQGASDFVTLVIEQR